jgi:hypothetical protein
VANFKATATKKREQLQQVYNYILGKQAQKQDFFTQTLSVTIPFLTHTPTI